MYQITINTKLCKGCGLCADYCPKHVYDITIGHAPVAERSADCIGCGICLMKCPDFALKVEGVQK